MKFSCIWIKVGLQYISYLHSLCSPADFVHFTKFILVCSTDQAITGYMSAKHLQNQPIRIHVCRIATKSTNHNMSSKLLQNQAIKIKVCQTPKKSANQNICLPNTYKISQSKYMSAKHLYKYTKWIKTHETHCKYMYGSTKMNCNRAQGRNNFML